MFKFFKDWSSQLKVVYCGKKNVKPVFLLLNESSCYMNWSYLWLYNKGQGVVVRGVIDFAFSLLSNFYVVSKTISLLPLIHSPFICFTQTKIVKFKRCIGVIFQPVNIFSRLTGLGGCKPFQIGSVYV